MNNSDRSSRVEKSLPLQFLFIASALACAAAIAGCSSSPPIKPEGKNIKVTRDEVDEDCKDLGLVEGRNMSVNGTFEQALEDLKSDAALKGANVVKLESTSGTGTAVRGQAYLCP